MMSFRFPLQTRARLEISTTSNPQSTTSSHSPPLPLYEIEAICLIGNKFGNWGFQSLKFQIWELKVLNGEPPEGVGVAGGQRWDTNALGMVMRRVVLE